MTAHTLALRLVALAAFCSMASMRVCDPMLVTLSAEFHVSTGEASNVVSGFAIAYGVMQLFYGPLGERLGKLQVVCFAALGCSVLALVTSAAPSLQLLVLARAAMGAAAAGIIPLSLAWIGDQVAYDRRQETLARLMVATVSGMMLGQWFGGFAADKLGWRSAFLVLAAGFFGTSVLLMRHLRRERRAGATTAPGAGGSYARRLIALLGRSPVRRLLAVTALEGGMAFGAMAFIPSQLVQRFGFTPSTAGGVMVLFGAGGLAYSLGARHWLRWLGERGLAGGGGCIVASAILTLGVSGQAWAAVAACFFAGLGFYMLHNTLQTRATQIAPEQRATAVTLFACSLFFGQSLGVLLMGYAVDHGRVAISFSAAALGLLVLGWRVARATRPQTDG